MAIFSDSDGSDFEVAAKPAKRSRVTKPKSAFVEELDSDSVPVDDESDFMVSEDDAPKKKKPAPKAKPAATKKAPAKKKATASATPEPLQPLDDTDMNEVHAPPAAGNAKSASSQYQKLSQLEHILKRPDTYIGSVERSESLQWVYDAEEKSMVHRNVSIVPGLYKIFDEILVNAADNKTRDPSMNLLEVTINAENNTISVYNNGKGIPIEIHEKEKIYIPELIFGNLLTSSNYDDDEKKVTGGRNGFGAKVSSLVFNFSNYFTNIYSCVIFFRPILKSKQPTRTRSRCTSRLGIITCQKLASQKSL